MDRYKEFINQNQLGLIKDNATFASITTFKVGGKIKLLFYPNSYSEFIEFYKFYIKDDLKPELFIIGNGSNILASDEEFNGIVVSFKNIKEDIKIEVKEKKYYVTCYSSTTLNTLSRYLMMNCISGGEFFHFIPGLVG